MTTLSASVEALNNIVPAVQVAPWAPKPDVLPLLDRLCVLFEASSAEEREVASELTPDAREVLISYAGIFAREAVRQRRTDYVVRGLTALSVGDGLSSLDITLAQAKLLHSAMLLQMDVVRVFEGAANLCRDTSNAIRLRRFPDSPGAYDLKNFGLRTVGNGEDFRYVDIGTPPASSWFKFWRRGP